MNRLTFYVFVACTSIYSTRSKPTTMYDFRPSYVQCISSDECSFDSCCVLGMARYSIPTCQQKLQFYESCRPNSEEPMNTTVTYLDGRVLSINNVHLIMCPCANGLKCDTHTGKCVQFDDSSNVNQIWELENTRQLND